MKTKMDMVDELELKNRQRKDQWQKNHLAIGGRSDNIVTGLAGTGAQGITKLLIFLKP